MKGRKSGVLEKAKLGALERKNESPKILWLVRTLYTVYLNIITYIDLSSRSREWNMDIKDYFSPIENL